MQTLESVADIRHMLDEFGIRYYKVDLGEIELSDKLSIHESEKLQLSLALMGMEIIENKKMILIEKMKTYVIKMIRYSDALPIENYSALISSALQHNYTYLANLFSASEKITLEHYIIKHKIEKVKELLLGDKYNLSEISQKMHYSSVAHLSNQFKKVTGETTTAFKNRSGKGLLDS